MIGEIPGRNSPNRKYAQFYDFYDGPRGRDEQLSMYRALAAESGGPVLELGCGTCIITIDLARAGYNVTGLDFSPDVLDVARRKIEGESPEVQARIRLVEGDMRQFRLAGAFGLILIPTNTFGCLVEDADQQNCLRCVRDHLSDSGVLIIEERFYSPMALVRLSEQTGAVHQHEGRVNPATGLYTSYNSATRHVDFARQLIYGRSFVEEVQADGSVKRYLSEERDHKGHAWWDVRRYLTPQELGLLIRQAGFTVKELWGSHDRGPLKPDSYNMIFMAQKPPGAT